MNNQKHGNPPIKNEQSGTVKPYLFDDMAQNNIQDQGKYVSLVDLQEFIFNTCNVEDNTIFIDFHNYLQFLARQRSLAIHPLSPEDIERAASKYAFENNTHRSNSKAFIAGANFAKQPHSNEWVKVEDGLPNIGDRILCIENDGDIQIAVYGVDKVIGEKDRVTNKPIACFLDEQDEQPSFYLPTHWMPLPKNPKK